MANKLKYVSNVAFTDLLFNIVVGLAFLFLLAFILMNPIAKEKDVEEKSDFYHPSEKCPDDFKKCPCSTRLQN